MKIDAIDNDFSLTDDQWILIDSVHLVLRAYPKNKLVIIYYTI